MSRVAYERVFGQSGYDAVARNKIKKLEEKMGGGSGGKLTVGFADTGDELICSTTFTEVLQAFVDAVSTGDASKLGNVPSAVYFHVATNTVNYSITFCTDGMNSEDGERYVKFYFDLWGEEVIIKMNEDGTNEKVEMDS